MSKLILSKRDKINFILTNYSKAEITLASCFEDCDVIAVTDMDDENENVVYFANKKDCEKDEETGEIRCVLKTHNKDLEAFDFLCMFKVNNEKYKEKVCKWIILF